MEKLPDIPVLTNILCYNTTEIRKLNILCNMNIPRIIALYLKQYTHETAEAKR